MKHVRIVVGGKVQAVYFRESAVRKARKLGLAGYVCNQADGTVYFEVEGQDEAVDAFVLWSQVGPPQATVESFKVSEHPAVGHTGFKRA